MRTLKPIWQSARTMQTAVSEGVLTPAELLHQIHLNFGLRWHLWRDGRGWWLLTEFDQRHQIRAKMPVFPTMRRDALEITLHFPKQLSTDEQQNLKSKLLACCSNQQVTFLARRRVEKLSTTEGKEAPMSAPPMRPVTTQDRITDSPVQPHELDRFLRMYHPTYSVQYLEPATYVVTQHEPHQENARIMLTIENFPRMNDAISPVPYTPPEYFQAQFAHVRNSAEVEKTKAVIKGALAILAHNRGFDPRTMKRY